MLEGDREFIIRTIADLADRGAELRTFTRDLIHALRDLLVLKLVAEPGDLLDLSEEELHMLKELAGRVTEEHLALVLNELVKSESDIRYSFSPRVALEMALLRTSYLSSFRQVNEAISSLTGGGPASEPVNEQVAPPRARPALPQAKPAPKTERTVEKRDEEPPKPSKPAPKAVTEMPPAEPEPEPESADDDEPIPADGEPVMVTEHTGPSLLKAVMSHLSSDPRVSSKLAVATGELEGNVFKLTFDSGDATICAKYFKDNPSIVTEIAGRLRGLPTRVQIVVRQSTVESKDDLKKKAMSAPLVKEAMDLFDGRIVNVRKTGD